MARGDFSIINFQVSISKLIENTKSKTQNLAGGLL